jgi:hypothetical protein
MINKILSFFQKNNKIKNNQVTPKIIGVKDMDLKNILINKVKSLLHGDWDIKDDFCKMNNLIVIPVHENNVQELLIANYISSIDIEVYAVGIETKDAFILKNIEEKDLIFLQKDPDHFCALSFMILPKDLSFIIFYPYGDYSIFAGNRDFIKKISGMEPEDLRGEFRKEYSYNKEIADKVYDRYKDFDGK